MKTAQDIESDMRAAVADGDYRKAGEIGTAAGFSLEFVQVVIAKIEIELGRKKIYPELQPAEESKASDKPAVAESFDQMRQRRHADIAARQRKLEQERAEGEAAAKRIREREDEELAQARARQEEGDREANAALAAIGLAQPPAVDGPDKSALLKAMNNRHAVITNYGGKCVVIEWKQNVLRPDTVDMEHQSFGAFKERYMNRYLPSYDGGRAVSLGGWWLCHASRRQYDGLDLVPNGPAVLPGNKLNLWQDWGVDEGEGDWGLIRWHIENVLAGGDSVFADYIIRWCAWKFQNPGEPNEVALVLRGGKGTGKGAFAQVLMRIFGSHALQIFSSAHLGGKHNKHLQNRLFLFADEAFWAGDREAERLLKGIVTEKVIMIEPKGVDAFQWRNRLSLLIAANEGWVVPASHDERRYAVNNINEEKKQNTTYFAPLFAQIENGGPAAMLYDLRRMPLGNWHPRNTVPQTKALIEQKMESLGGLEQWWVSLLQTGELPPVEKNNRRMVRASYLFRSAKEHNFRNKYLNDTQLGRFMKEMGCEHKSNGKAWCSVMLPLAEARKRWVVRVGGEWDWLYSPRDWEQKPTILD
jgi:hypothetical protein